jgi:hypothetical protein
MWRQREIWRESGLLRDKKSGMAWRSRLASCPHEVLTVSNRFVSDLDVNVTNEVSSTEDLSLWHIIENVEYIGLSLQAKIVFFSVDRCKQQQQ